MGQVGITDTLEFGDRPSTLPLPLPPRAPASRALSEFAAVGWSAPTPSSGPHVQDAAYDLENADEWPRVGAPVTLKVRGFGLSEYDWCVLCALRWPDPRTAGAGACFNGFTPEEEGGDPPPPLQTKVTTVGKNEIYKRENLPGPFLVHKLWGPRPPPFFLFKFKSKFVST